MWCAWDCSHSDSSSSSRASAHRRKRPEPGHSSPSREVLAVGYIDADAHVVECAHTWDFFDPGEEHLRPTVTDTHLTVEDLCLEWPAGDLRRCAEEIYPPGSVYLDDPAARIRYMDELGVDVH